MTRWNIRCIFFMGVEGQRRDIELAVNGMTVITGASGTGKSALIKAVDYTLGSKSCELPAHIRRRSIAVGVEWVRGDHQMIVGRVIPPIGQKSSTRMYVSSGRNLRIPASLDSFEGATNLSTGKAFIERAFGIGDRPEHSDGRPERGRATIRHATPYMFVTKEVIDSETVLLHGLEQVKEAPAIIEAMPYFLRAVDEQSAAAERRLRQLRYALERAEAQRRAQAEADTEFRQRATSLLAEARRVGVDVALSPDSTESELLGELERVASGPLQTFSYPSEDELASLQSERRDLLSQIDDRRRKQRAARTAQDEAVGFQGVVARQRAKLGLVEHLQLDTQPAQCPVCDAPSEKGRELARELRTALERVRSESAAVERVTPRLVEHSQALADELQALNRALRGVDDRIATWIQQDSDARRLATVTQLQAHLLGRISYFLEASQSTPARTLPDLGVLRAEIEELAAQVDPDARRLRLQRAERRISRFATEIFAALPTVAPCVGSELEFSTRGPELMVSEAETNVLLRMPEVGSDQNYLAMHIALCFALQRYLGLVEGPVPGVLILDQISRPYFPNRGEEADEEEISGGEEDEDIRAVRQHLDFLFTEANRQTGLQILLIEHAYFADDPRFVAATKERWNRGSGRALIPLDWPTRPDVDR